MDKTGLTIGTPRPRMVYSRIGIACFIILVLTTILQYAAVYLVMEFAPLLVLKPWFFWVISFVPMYAVAVPVGIAIIMRASSFKPEPSRMGPGSFMIFLIMSFSIAYIGNIAGLLINSLVGRFIDSPAINPVELLISSSSIYLRILVLVILAPVIEELIFRKLIIDRIRGYGEGLAVIVSGLMFGLFHGNLYQFFYAFGLGALFAYIYVRTGRLRYTVLLHMIINFMSGALLPLLSEGIEPLQSIDPSDSEAFTRYFIGHLPQLLGLIAYGLFVVAAGIAGLVLFIIRRKTFRLEPAPMQIAKGSGFKTVFLNVGMILFVAGTLAMTVMNLLNINF